MTDNEATYLLENSDSVLCYDTITHSYFRASKTLLQNGLFTLGLLAQNRHVTLSKQAALFAAYSEMEHSWKRYLKAIEEVEKRERKRLRNRKKMERMKRLRVKKVKR